MQAEFNLFRMRMLGSWLLSNTLLIVLVAVYDPRLTGFANFSSGTVIYTIGLKLIGSFMYQFVRLVRWSFRKLCGCCYRIDQGETGIERVVCCSRPTSYYALDDLWETEHPYDHW